jgi:phosphonate transport system substrate-binding protein
MKKSKLLTMLAVSAFLVGGLVSCGGNSDDGKKETINVQFVPSRDAGKLATLASNLEPLLNATTDKYEFKITTGTSYAATTEAMLAGQIDIGFLTASGYAEATLKHPGEVEVLLTSVRKGYQVQEDFTTEKEQRAAMNGEKSDYEYLGQQTTGDVNWYSSILVVSNDYYKDNNGDGVIDIKDMVGLTVARQGTTSGAGYLRPLKYLNDYGLEMVDEITDATKQIKGLYIKGYDAALEAMLSGEVAGYWGFMDVRYSNAYSKTESTFYQSKEIFTSSKCVAITDGIYNDTISARSGLSSEAKEAVKKAFNEVVKQGTITEEGTGAYYLYNLYSHTGYTEAKDSDFDGEREFYQYCVDHNLI